MNSPAPTTPRKSWVDFGKGVSMFLVVLYHSESYYPMSDADYSNLFAFFRMPFFFFLSGYLFTSDYLRFSLKRKMLQIFRGIIWTYLIFTSIIWIPKALSNAASFLQGLAEILLGWASWFVVALGGAQILFAIVLRRTKNLSLIAAFTLLSLVIGYHTGQLGRLPFQLDKIGLVVFFFGLGFFYRIYEERLKPYLNGSLKNTLGFTLLYFGSYAVDVLFWHSTLNVFGVHTYHHFPLYILHALLGISMMICLCKLVPTHKLKWICFMGINSLVFYYLNGGVIKVLRALYNAIGIHLPPAFGYFEILFMAISASFVIAGIVLLIKRYIPIIIGDKTAFNVVAEWLGLRIRF